MQGINSWIIADILLIGYYFDALLFCLGNPFTLRACLLLIGKCWVQRYVGWRSIQHCHVGGKLCDGQEVGRARVYRGWDQMGMSGEWLSWVDRGWDQMEVGGCRCHGARQHQ